MPSLGWHKGNPTIQITRTCYYCGREFKVWPSQIKSRKNRVRMACSRECRLAHTSLWENGRYRTSHGYFMVLKPGVTKSSKLTDMVYEHRVIAEKILGRPLKASEMVHHINGKPDDNRPENLLVVDGSSHKKLRKAPSVVICENCGHHNYLAPIKGIILSAP